MTTLTAETVNIAELEALSPEDLLAWAFKEHGDRAAIVTSFQKAGCVMIDMASHVAPGLRILTIDTMRLHDETYAVMDEVEARYGTTVERFQPDPEKIRRMIDRHGEYLFFDSKAKQQYCCKVRKVEPHANALATIDVWIAGVRRDQSDHRKKTAKASIVGEGGRHVLKLCPMADWTDKQVADYISEYDVPYNRLYDKGYTSIGCNICTTPTQPGEDKRAGRWRWFNYLDKDDKECGIHTSGSGI
jgi:phosphoadenylyl-sulfate reductase (thioredoxin)